MANNNESKWTRRTTMKLVGAVAALAPLGRLLGGAAPAAIHRPKPATLDPRPPSANDWQKLEEALQGQLLEVSSPLDICRSAPGSPAAMVAIEDMKNPFFLEEQPGATHTTGWIGAFDAAVSPQAIAVENAGDIALAVDFASKHGLKLVIKGTGHDYLGRSSAPDSLPGLDSQDAGRCGA